jgi:hypothetical protein
MPPASTGAKILVPFVEHATEFQGSLGAEVNVQFWPKAGAAAHKRLPIAAVKKRENLLIRITLIAAAICKSAFIARFSPEAQLLNLWHSSN